jgi:hypothetical protein
MSEITLLLDAISSGESHASEDLLPLIYDELRRLAVGRMAGEAAGHTLQPTALMHEAWLRLVNIRVVQRGYERSLHILGQRFGQPDI